MAFKDILVHVDNSPQCGVRLGLAARLAKDHQAHLIALNVRHRQHLPQYIAAQYGSILDKIEDEHNAEAAREARAIFDRIQPDYGVTTEWRDVDGPLESTVALHARYVDLTVVGQPLPGEDGPGLADSLILEVGRPVLVVPYAGRFDTIGERILVAWNGSREATRAVHDALPILTRAKLAHVIAVNPTGGMAGHGDVPGADICLHLSRHGANAVCEHIRSEDLNIGEMLLSRAADEDVDLLVMGAYGRSRLRELVMGGATRHLLHHMTVPVLMSH
ncbi:Universal stress protein UspA and related nucleotide-binding proteins [Magnetospirillum sp. LM-5]|uniref:universal stress protein n=1 Tax=Magnetospirillum sp. LM-5 TaxID=2681466 RepID=UPI00137D2846|nr:universal stress protein [Magnetospirillum sp. LM-5]CAA7624704.1 Universal stress protein UspA and related nucleotide-binding proteins [Magnetospirillum sp. LM-5]